MSSDLSAGCKTPGLVSKHGQSLLAVARDAITGFVVCRTRVCSHNPSGSPITTLAFTLTNAILAATVMTPESYGLMLVAWYYSVPNKPALIKLAA